MGTWADDGAGEVALPTKKFVGTRGGGLAEGMYEREVFGRGPAITLVRVAGGLWRGLVGSFALAGVVLLLAQEPRPGVGAGATRDEVIDVYGWPTGQSKAGTREVLSYPQGQVMLENGRVESVNFTMKPPWPPPRPRPGNVPAPVAKQPEPTPAPGREPPPAPVVPPAAASPAPVEPVAAARVAAVPQPASSKSVELSSSLFTARNAVIAALVLGVAISAVLFWLVWRRWTPAAESAPVADMKTRISDAASGLPSQINLAAWPRARLAALVAAYVEAEGYQPEIRPGDGDIDIVIRRAGGTRPQVVILCEEGGAGVVTAKRVREFFGTVTAEGAETGWYVAPAGFAAEAKAFAEQHQVRLLDGPGLAAQLRDLPPLVVAKVMARALG